MTHGSDKPLELPPGHLTADVQGQCLVGGPLRLRKTDVTPEPGHPVHRRLHRHTALDSLGPHGSREGVPVRPPVPGHPHDVLLEGVPVTSLGSPNALELGAEIRGPPPTLWGIERIGELKEVFNSACAV